MKDIYRVEVYRLKSHNEMKSTPEYYSRLKDYHYTPFKTFYAYWQVTTFSYNPDYKPWKRKSLPSTIPNYEYVEVLSGITIPVLPTIDIGDKGERGNSCWVIPDHNKNPIGIWPFEGGSTLINNNVEELEKFEKYMDSNNEKGMTTEINALLKYIIYQKTNTELAENMQKRLFRKLGI